MKVMCIDDKSQNNPYMYVIPFGEVVTVVSESKMYEDCWVIKEYLLSKRGIRCSYFKRFFAPISDIDEKEILEQRQEQLQTA